MSEYVATVRWERNDHAFVDNRYSRVHRWEFDGGITVTASPSTHIVREPFADAHAVDPEEAYVVSLSSCHMLMFLSIAAKRGFVIDSYVDEAVGTLEKRADGMLWMSRVTLRPAITVSGTKRPTSDEVAAMHDEAHHECFIANSVKTAVECVPTLATATVTTGAS